MARNALAPMAALAAMLLANSALAAVTYLGNLLIDGKGTDLSGLAFTVEDGSRANGLDGFGSGLAYTGLSPAPNVYRFLSITDRGPNRSTYGKAGALVDNTTSYPTRFQTWDITVKPADAGKYSLAVSLVKTTLFKNEAGWSFVGRSDQFTSQDPSQNLRFDPESVRVAPDGTLFVSDEYGPSIYHFDENGKRIGMMHVPDYYHVKKLSPRGSEEIDRNTVGRVANKGWEGLAITPDGSHLIAAIQSPLLQDGGEKSRYERFAIFDAKTGQIVREVVYALDQDGVGNAAKTTISDIVALNDHEVLVDERDSKKNKTKLAYIADLNSGSDVSGKTSLLAAEDLDPAIKPVTKTLLFDLKATILASDPLTNVPPGYTSGIPDKIEGFAFGPELPDGRRLMVVTNDNDFLLPAFANGTSATNKSADGTAGYPNYFFVFAVDAATIPGFVPEEFAPAHIAASASPAEK